MTVSIRLLGSPTAANHLGEPIALNGQPSLLLAKLATDSGPVNRAQLASFLFPASKNARGLLSATLMSLQKSIGYGAINATRSTLELKQDSGLWLDIWAWKEAGRQLRNLHRSPSEASVSRLEELIGLFRGDFLQWVEARGSANVENWLLIERAHYKYAYIEWVTHLLRIYRIKEQDSLAVSLIKQAFKYVPFHEPFHIAYMQHLAMLGQDKEALNWGRTHQPKLRRANGSPTSRDFDAMLNIIRRGEITRGIASMVASEPTFVPPSRATFVIGRDKQIERITSHLLHRKHRLITLTGIGGIGKTTIALEVAHNVQPHQSQGVCWLSFLEVVEPQSIEQARYTLLNRVAQQFSLESEADLDSLENRVLQQLAKCELLLVLDNFEHLVSAQSTLAHIVERTSSISVLVTSRQALSFELGSTEPVWGLDWMHSNDSQVLFEQTALKSRPDFVMDDSNSAAIQEICATVGGHPLSLELAAQWTSIFSPEEINAAINKQLNFLINPSPEADSRRRSLVVILMKSWTRLSEENQHLLKHLATFKGDFAVAAATEICEATPLQLLKLRTLGLIKSQKPGWLSIHPLVQRFILERPGDRGSVEAAR